MPTVIGLLPHTQHQAAAYNLTITNPHTYHVVAGSTPVLVHNAGPFCGTPFGKNTSGDVDFHGTGYSLNELTQFTYGHTGAGNPAMGRPSLRQIEDTLRNAGPIKINGQNAARFEHNGVRVIINYDAPWRSTAYFPGNGGT
jgi:hypothetical protein